MSTSEPRGSHTRRAYRRSSGSPRGEARRRELLDKVTDDLEARGLVDFSLRQAARAAGTTHKVLLYYFDGVDDLMRQALLELRHRRINAALVAVAASPADQTLAARVATVWKAWTTRDGAHRVLDQASGLAIYDPDRYSQLGREATEQYLPSLVTICPQEWPTERKEAIAALILATLRGLLVDWLTNGAERRVEAALEALLLMLDREQSEV
jgi:AcrR family transcriptional regulator